MTMEDLYSRVERAASQYEQACQREEGLYDMMQDAERDYARYSAEASTAEDASAQNAATRQMLEAQKLYLRCQSELQQVQNAKAQAQRELQATRSGVTDAIGSLEESIPKLERHIGTFEQMAANPFGASAAAQLPQLRATLERNRQNLNQLYTLADRIDSVLNGDGTSPQRVLRRR